MWGNEFLFEPGGKGEFLFEPGGKRGASFMGEDGALLLQILRKHTDHDYIHILQYDSTRRKIVSIRRLTLNKNLCTKSPTLLFRLNCLQKLELRDCPSLPIQDLKVMTSLKWLDVYFASDKAIKNFSLPSHRDWYPPNLETFLINHSKVNSDPLDALMTASILMKCAPIQLNGDKVCTLSEILLGDNIGYFLKKCDEENKRITELCLSFALHVLKNTNFTGQFWGALDLPPTIGQLNMLKELWLDKVRLIPKELSNLVHLRFLRLDYCSDFSDSNPTVILPSVLSVEVRMYASVSLMRWITSCFPNLKKLSVLQMLQDSLDNVFSCLGNVESTGNSFQNSLNTLHMSAFYICHRGEDLLLGILANYSNLAKLHVNRIAFGLDGKPAKDLVIRKILSLYPQVREISLGCYERRFSFETPRWNHPSWNCPRRNDHWTQKTVPATMLSYPHNTAHNGIILNLNRCGRQLLNQSTLVLHVFVDKIKLERLPFNSSRWIPVSLWARVLERAQRIPYAGCIRSHEDRLVQEASALHFLLRNGPAFAFRQEFGFQFVKETNEANLSASKKRKRAKRG